MKRTFTCSLLFALALPLVALADGAAIYKTKCTPCHGADGAGQTPVGKNLKVRDLRSAEAQKLTDAEITKVLTDGKGKMPKSKLAADDMKAVIAFLRTLKK
ncbi:MAG: cytochrome c [Acidobacteriota bacterium]